MGLSTLHFTRETIIYTHKQEFKRNADYKPSVQRQAESQRATFKPGMRSTLPQNKYFTCSMLNIIWKEWDSWQWALLSRFPTALESEGGVTEGDSCIHQTSNSLMCFSPTSKREKIIQEIWKQYHSSIETVDYGSERKQNRREQNVI